MPYDGYIAQVHAGEAIMDAPAVAVMRRYFGAAPATSSGNQDAMLAEFQAMRKELAQFRADSNGGTGALMNTVAKATAAAADKTSNAVTSAGKMQAQAKELAIGLV